MSEIQMRITKVAGRGKELYEELRMSTLGDRNVNGNVRNILKCIKSRVIWNDLVLKEEHIVG